LFHPPLLFFLWVPVEAFLLSHFFVHTVFELWSIKTFFRFFDYGKIMPLIKLDAGRIKNIVLTINKAMGI
jgi:hypothetical protein